MALGVSAAVCALIAALSLAPVTLALEPKVVSPAPGETVEIVEGQPFSFTVPFEEAREVRFSIAGGPTIATDLFAPFGDHIPTRHFSRIGIPDRRLLPADRRPDRLRRDPGDLHV